MMLQLFTLLSCTGSASDSSVFLDSAIVETSDSAGNEACSDGVTVLIDSQSVASGSTLSFGESPSLGPSLRITAELRNPCTDKLRFLGHPDDWISGDGFLIEELPPVFIDGDETASVTLAFQPPQTGDYQGVFSLPHNHPDSPYSLSLEATAAEPATVVLVGDGGHTATTVDYGATFAYDHFDSLVPGDSFQRGVCWGNGGFVSVGGLDSEEVWISADGIDWEQHTSQQPAIADCAYGDGQFVGVSDRLVFSQDGREWSQGSIGTNTQDLLSIAYGGGVFVAVGVGGRAASTVDGIQWQSDLLLDAHTLRKIVYGNDRFVAVGDNGWLATSTNGEVWVTQQVGNGSVWGGLAYSDGSFVIGNGSEIMASSDGRNWALVAYGNVVPIVAVGRMLLGIGGNSLFQSENMGGSWIQSHSFSAGLEFESAASSMN